MFDEIYVKCDYIYIYMVYGIWVYFTVIDIKKPFESHSVLMYGHTYKICSIFFGCLQVGYFNEDVCLRCSE